MNINNTQIKIVGFPNVVLPMYNLKFETNVEIILFTVSVCNC